MKRREFLRNAATTFFAFSGLSGAYGWYGGHSFVVSRHSRRLPGLKAGLKIVQLSDLHYGNFYRSDAVRSWVQAAMRQQAELILITGDFLDDYREPEDIDVLVKELANLHAPLGVYGVLGNHDYYEFWDSKLKKVRTSVSYLEEQLAKVNIHLLVNSSTKVRNDLHLAGLDDLWNGQPNLELALANQPKAGATILMSHNPDILPNVPDDVALTISGHTHGGQIRLPIGISLHSVSKYGERFQMGFVNSQKPGVGALGFVSRGLGATAVPLRAFCPAEVVVLNLMPE